MKRMQLSNCSILFCLFDRLVKTVITSQERVAEAAAAEVVAEELVRARL